MAAVFAVWKDGREAVEIIALQGFGLCGLGSLVLHLAWERLSTKPVPPLPRITGRGINHLMVEAYGHMDIKEAGASTAEGSRRGLRTLPARAGPEALT
jgi:hypothetical protein